MTDNTGLTPAQLASDKNHRQVAFFLVCWNQISLFDFFLLLNYFSFLFWNLQIIIHMFFVFHAKTRFFKKFIYLIFLCSVIVNLKTSSLFSFILLIFAISFLLPVVFFHINISLIVTCYCAELVLCITSNPKWLNVTEYNVFFRRQLYIFYFYVGSWECWRIPRLAWVFFSFIL